MFLAKREYLNHIPFNPLYLNRVSPFRQQIPQEL